MSYFPNNDEEKELLQFIGRYQYLNGNNVKYFFKTQKYYRKRITNLVSRNFLKRIKLDLILDDAGIKYLKMIGAEYNKLNRDKRYVPRLLYLSNIGAFYNKCETVKFIPSFEMKDRKIYTTTSRKYIGILSIKGIDYLTYRISKDHDNKYLGAVIYDIQKEKDYKNIIVFIDDVSRININDFSFGNNQVLIIQDDEENREELKYLHSIDWNKIIKDNYKNKVVLSEYSFCDYTNHKDKFISIFKFLDAEKISKIQYFLRENKNKNIDIICNKEIENTIRKEIPRANYKIVDLEEYIEKEIKIYD